MEKPPVLLGYTSEGKSRPPPTAGVTPADDIQIGHGDNTYLTMFVTVEPPLKQADPVKEKVITLTLYSICTIRQSIDGFVVSM